MSLLVCSCELEAIVDQKEKETWRVNELSVRETPAVNEIGSKHEL